MSDGYPPERQGLYDPRFEHDACGVGFVCNIDGRPSHEIIQRGLQVLVNLTHRGATGADAETGDGAGILMQIPHAFLERECASLGIRLPEPGEYGVGSVFLPQDPGARARCESLLERTVADEGQHFLGWRDVPVHAEQIGESARRILPRIRQCFVLRGSGFDGAALERKLFVIRKVVENALRTEGIRGFHVPSLSCRTLVYKGLLLAYQVKKFYPDLADPAIESGLALVHQRYSTNTWPTWERAHPYRYLCHNGEINTVRGNHNWMRAREAVIRSGVWGDDLAKIMPLINPDGSDSGMVDNVLEFLVLSGRELPHAMMMLIPEAWDRDPLMRDEKKAFYEYHQCLMEPWDGPASIGFSDGTRIGAVLDRNGLRPSRYWVTKDGFVVLSSECGVLPINPEDVKYKGRLQPGRMLLIDTSEGRIIPDEELKSYYARRRPYREWLRENMLKLNDLPARTPDLARDGETDRLTRQKLFGYSLEDLRILLPPMAANGVEADGSMGNDTPIAVLSDRAQLLFNYFKQVFAQVTNPPIDSIREDSVMSLISTVGSERNILEETPEHARLLELEQPVLSSEEFEKIRQIRHPWLRSATIDCTFEPPTAGTEESLDFAGAALRDALDRIRREAVTAVRGGAAILVLSDRAAGPARAAVPSLLATAAVHHHLCREGLRMRCGLVVETGEAREVAHFALLIGFGAAAVHPYLAFESVRQIVADATWTPAELTAEKAQYNYVKAVGKGLLKIFAKMGISTLQSYRGAQIFEAVGIEEPVVREFFSDTATRIGGVGLGVIAREALLRHQTAYPANVDAEHELDIGGEYQWRRGGERHLLNPTTIHKLQHAVRRNDVSQYREYAKAINDQTREHYTIRGMLRFKPAAAPIPLEEVEPASEILKRFCSGAMSFGSISAEAHETLAIAMNRIGGKSNSGEGGEDPKRFARDPNGDWRRSAIKQVASGRFGVSSWYLVNADELQIKIAQGAKPGEGGQLAGRKVNRWIARVRNSTPGVGLISPPPHHDIYSIEDLAQLIHDLKNANPKADISVKLVSVSGVGTIAAGVSKGHAESVQIAGFEGGTGASPLTSIKHAGVPWEIGLAETQQALVLNDLRGRIRVHVDGQLRTGRDVVIGAILGADEFGFGTIALVALGCIMMRVCHLNTCPVGVATQNEQLRKKFTGDPQHAVNFFRFVADDVREILASLGVRRLDDVIGRTDLLEANPEATHWKLPTGLDWSAILHRPDAPYEGVAIRRTCGQQHGLEKALDLELIRLCRPAIENMEPVELSLPIRNVNRTVGTMLGSTVSLRHGLEGLPDNTIRIRFTGSAGQSFGAFLPKGITLTLSGDANDYTGKGLSGGRVVVFPHPESTFDASQNIVIGNVALYGATAGEAFFCGVAGERFAVRNSGARAVVEGVGDHGCEYMTGGRVVVLGNVGRNFAAGMSGGIAYVLDPLRAFPELCNPGTVDLERVESDADERELRDLIEAHFRHTRSELAEQVLEKWATTLPNFVKVFPREYKRALLGIEFGSGDY
jgi:glutamate synthase domain-containing protein 2/glutamate synthase domain-containing protein 1/glutamate synthase domain-containing protein 3